MAHSLRYLANCSIMFTELPLLQRPAAARSAGFEAVEFWWPFDRPVPGDAAVGEFVAAIADAGVALVALKAIANIAAAAAAAARTGAAVLVEPLSGPGSYPLRLAADAAAVVGRARAAGAENAEARRSRS